MSEQDQLLLTYTLFASVYPTEKTERVDRPWGDLVQDIRAAPIYIDKQHCPLISLCEYGDEIDGAHKSIRYADNVRRCYGVELDYDGELMTLADAAAKLSEARIQSLLYTSPSHRPHAPRWRVLLPLSEPAVPEKRAEYAGRANRVLGGVATPESFRLSQSFYIGRVRNTEYEVLETEGRQIDLAAELEAMYPIGHEKDGEIKRDERTDTQLRECFARGEGRYEAMLKLSSRWAVRGLTVDDIESSLLELLGNQPHNADGIDLRTRARPLAESAWRKYGDSRKKSSAVLPNDAASAAQPAEAASAQATQGPSDPPPRAPMQWTLLRGRTPPERAWHISHWLTDGPTLLSGLGGIGKTLLAQTIATALAMGRNFLDTVHGEHKVLFWACEDSHDELWRRQVAICRYFDIEIDALEGRLIVESRLGQDNSLYVPVFGVPTWTPLLLELMSQVKDYGAQTLILDNIGQTYGCSENDRHAVTTFLNRFPAVCPATVLLGHPAKAVGSEFSGSTAWENAVRMRWWLGTQLPDQKEEEPEPDQNVRYLSKRKTNYTIKDYRKFEYRDGVFVPESDSTGPGSFTARYTFAHRQQGAEEVILEGISVLKGIGQHGRSAPTSPDYLPKKLTQMKLTQGFTDKELRDALNRLLLANRVKEVEIGKLANRQPRMGLVAL